jgi:predicted ATPase
VLHERTGRAIESLHAHALDEHYEELSHHYGRSANIAKAVEYLHFAGEQDVEVSAYVQGIEKLGRAANLLATLPPGTKEHMEREVLIQLALGKALGVTQGLVSVEAERAYARARVLCEQTGQASQRLSALAGLCVIHTYRGETDKGKDIAEQLFSLARDTRHSPHLIAAHVLMADASFSRGDFVGTRQHEEEAIRFYQPGEYGEAYFFGFVHSQVVALSYLCLALYALGYPEQALTRCREAVALARKLSHPFSEAAALVASTFVHIIFGDWKSCREAADTAIALADEHGFSEYVGLGAFQRVDALMGLGELDLHEGIAVMRAVFDAARAMGAVWNSQELLPRVVERYKETGQFQEGLALVAEALEIIGKTGLCVFESEMNRLKGELIFARSSSRREEAEACFGRAIDIARSQSAKFYELRAATGLARIWQNQGRRDEARNLLAPVYGWFTEGFDTGALKEAKALLDKLG